MKKIKRLIGRTLSWVKYIRGKVVLMFNKLDINILTIDETIAKLKQGCSMVRFGDGEFMLMAGRDIKNYQRADKELGRGLKKVISAVGEDEKLLVCIPDTINSLENCTKSSKKHWTIRLGEDIKLYKSICRKNIAYGNVFVTRPYMAFKNRENCGRWFSEIRSLFGGKDFVLIEGKYSRLGVGNDLFEGAKSLKRILCPPKNSYGKYDEILKAAKEVPKNNIILLSVGPAGKLLAYDLFKCGYMVWDIGHIDSEYEWFLNSSQSKTTIANKHTAEGSNEGADIGECNDVEYLNSIIMEIE